MQVPGSVFLSMAEQIAAENPVYRLGHSGGDGSCDCIGLVIGAIRRAGGKWSGFHGTNYAARHAVTSLKRINSAADLEIGELVFKAHAPGKSGYSLPARYRSGPDRNDYYHVGIVLSVSPLRIRHMTSPKAKVDTRLGQWSRHGWCAFVSREVYSAPENIRVESTNGLPVKLRARPNAACPLWWIVDSGTEARLTDVRTGWCRIEAPDTEGHLRSGWMIDRFIVRSRLAQNL